MPYRLILHLPEGPRRVPLLPGEHVLGSEEGCDIRLRHMTVSRRHALFRVTKEGLWIEDMGSSNGTSLESRPLEEATRIDGPCKLGFGAVRACLEEVAAGDLISAVRASPLEPTSATLPQAPVEPESGREMQGPEQLSETQRRTLSSSALEELTLRRLPRLVKDLSAGVSEVAAAQRVGADLFHSLPCFELEIWKETPGGKVVWFSAKTEHQPVDRSGVVTDEIAPGANVSLHIRAGFVQRSLARQLSPLIRVGLHLVGWSATHGPTAAGLRPASGPGTALAPSAPSAPSAGSAAGPTPESAGRADLPEPATVDAQVRRVYAQAERVARSEIGLLIRGESGTGKEVMARFVHRASGKTEAPFVAINCAALSRDLLEVELFGIEHGVATGVDARAGKFELAHGGTLFLDEIGDMAPETQAKILRVLQEGELYRIGGREPRPARPRILSATHRDLEAMIQEGSFRRDLYYRLAGWVAQLPALRERRVDLPNLAARFLAEEAASLGRDLPGISVSAMDALMAYDWPGNIRELRHEIGRAALFLDAGELLDSTLLSPGLQAGEAAPSGVALKDRLEQFEKAEILRTVEHVDGDIPLAAEMLGVARSTLYRRMKALGIPAGGAEGSDS